jgi:hypothetical protein
MYPVKVALKAVIANLAFEFNDVLALAELLLKLLSKLLFRLSCQDAL